MKKILALVVAALLTLSMVAALAEAPSMDGYKQNVKFTGGDEGNTVIMVQLLSAALDEANVMNYTATNDCPEAYDTEAEITAAATDANAITAIANAIGVVNGANSTTSYKAVFNASGEATVENVPAGWYYAIVQGTSSTRVIYKNMLVNTTPIPNGADGWQTALNGVATTATSAVTVKKTTDEIHKGVGATPEMTAEIDTDNAYQIGDKVPYRIETNIPNYPADSTYAKFNITDTPTYLTDIITTSGDDALTVTVDGSPVASSDSTWTIARKDASDEDGFKITFAQSYVLANPGKAVVVTYKATIKEGAQIALDGETATNTANIEFNPNPYIDEDVKPGDTTKLYTYGVFVEKQDGDGAALEGAVIGLYSDEACTTELARATTAIATYEGNDGKAYVSFNDLRAGTYYLKEITPPSGYKLNTTVFTVQVDDTHKGLNDPLTSEAETNFNKPTNSPIINTPGSTLPSTGGIGTTLFYIGGSILVLAAVILLVTKRRMSAND